MTEMVMVSSILILIFAWLLYFGRGMMRAQHAIVMSRYEVWRSTANAPGPRPVGTIPGSGTNRQFNYTFFDGTAEDIDMWNHHGFYREPQDAQIAGPAAKSYDTGQMAEAAFDRFPSGRTARFITEHAEPIQAYEELSGPMRHRQTRLNGDWRYANSWRIKTEPLKWEYRGGGPSMFASIRDAYFQPLDTQLEGLSSGGNSLAGMMRNLYLHRPAYVGPEVRF